MTVHAERYDKDCSRLLVDGRIVGFALRCSDGRWIMTDPNDVRIGKQAFRTPKDVAAAFERRFHVPATPEPTP